MSAKTGEGRLDGVGHDAREIEQTGLVYINLDTLHPVDVASWEIPCMVRPGFTLYSLYNNSKKHNQVYANASQTRS